MSDKLNATFQFLAKTENEAALQVLVGALDYPHRAIRNGALRALLDRRSPPGHREVFRRLSSMDEACREVINERPERLADVVADALQNPSPRACEAACNAVVSFRLYGVLPALTKVLTETETPHAELLAKTILELTDLFYTELSGAEDQPKLKRPDALRDRITTCLEKAVRKFHRHKCPEVIEALLSVAKPKNATLRQLLRRPQESCHEPMMELLSTSSRGSVIRLLLGFLEDAQMPRVVSDVIRGRCDAKFVEHLLWTVGPKPSKSISQTLSRFDSIAWVESKNELFDELDDQAQEAAVQLLVISAIDPQKVLAAIRYLLLHGKLRGRRAAAEALKQLEGPEIPDMIVEALDDQDAQVRASLAVQLRPRRVPDAYLMLVGMVDDPDLAVKQALREAMPEFTLRQFLANFDAMNDRLRPTAGHLVRKIDADIVANLSAKIQSLSPVARRRAVAAANAMGLVQELEGALIKRLSDDDHMVRVEAAKALAECKSLPSWEALRDALLDRSLIVTEAAEQSLELISESLLGQMEEEEQLEEETVS